MTLASRMAADPAQPDASRGEAWFAVALLCLFIAISFVDRNILALLVDPIRADLGVSDKQIGLLFGLGFALFYVCFGIPAAHLADHGNRKRLLLFGVILWSATTIAAGFATSFAALAVTRAGVAIGEAVLTPIAISLIADLFPADRRSLPTSINLIAGALMGAGSAVLGGAAYAAAQMASVSLDIAAWRLTFVIVGVPGLVLAAIFALTVREPRRLEDAAPANGPALGLSMADVFRYFFAHFRLYGMCFIATGVLAMVGNGLVAWGPTLLVRDHGMTNAAAGGAFGGAALVGVALGSILVPLIVRRSSGQAAIRRIVFAMTAFPAVALPIMAVTIASADLTLVLAGIGIGMAGIVSGPIFAPLLVQVAAPGRYRARMTAIYLFFNILISVSLGPLLVPVVTDWAGIGIGPSIALIGWGALILALLCYALAVLGLPRGARGASVAPSAE